MSKKQMRINPLPDKPGFAAWFDGTIRITDPSYVTSRFPGVRPLDDLTVTIKEDGLWEITTTLMDRAPDQRTGSLVMRRVAANPKPEDTEVVLLGKAGVDTGYAAIVAEKFGRIDNWTEYYDRLSSIHLEAGQIAHLDGTLVVTSGIGDGNFSVYGTRHRQTGELVRVTVDFTPSQDEWETVYGGAR